MLGEQLINGIPCMLLCKVKERRHCKTSQHDTSVDGATSQCNFSFLSCQLHFFPGDRVLRFGRKNAWVIEPWRKGQVGDKELK